MTDERDRDLETFRLWMDQLNHEDFLISWSYLSEYIQPAGVYYWIHTG